MPILLTCRHVESILSVSRGNGPSREKRETAMNLHDEKMALAAMKASHKRGGIGAASAELVARQTAKVEMLKSAPPCVVCGELAVWSVGWLYPTKADACAETADNRPACSVKCAIAAKAIAR